MARQLSSGSILPQSSLECFSGLGRGRVMKVPGLAADSKEVEGNEVIELPPAEDCSARRSLPGRITKTWRSTKSALPSSCWMTTLPCTQSKHTLYTRLLTIVTELDYGKFALAALLAAGIADSTHSLLEMIICRVIRGLVEQVQTGCRCLD